MSNMYQHQQLTAQNYQQQPNGQQYNGMQMPQQQQQLQYFKLQQAPLPPLTEQAMIAQQSIGSAQAKHQPVYQAINLNHLPTFVSGLNNNTTGAPSINRTC
ncbi:hypothetical protein BV898_18230 [Hypsibius exemplaris]|uniref:Uncharacterized protein n=1 Tax=Hypsibius exemplaris TaxID=2072580 RepID=A0A9X6RMX4_HYPEX|nr:hypothetical protein BV898_18230 [Hypsibius exemplaris]